MRRLWWRLFGHPLRGRVLGGTLNLLDDARLTDEERDDLFRTKIVIGGILQREPVIERLFSDAATEKALWEAVRFLEATRLDALHSMREPSYAWFRGYEDAVIDLTIAYKEAGIARPRNLPLNEVREEP